MTDVKYNDVVRALGIDVRKAENWQTRDVLPVEIVRPSVRGRAARVAQANIKPLAAWLLVAELVGPSRANEITEDIICGARFPEGVTFQVGYCDARIDFENMFSAIDRMCRDAQRRAA